MAAEDSQPERRQPWDGVVRREIDVDVRVLNEEDRSIEVVASTETLDSHGDILKQFWDLTRYSSNPAVLWNHNMFESSPYSFGGAVRPEDVMPIGKATDVRIDAGQLVARLHLLKTKPEDNEKVIDALWRRIQQQVVRAVSVGFRPGSVTRILNEDGSTNHYELGSPEHPNELREISFVPMGSNPDAVAKSIAWERENLGRVAAKTIAHTGQEIAAMAMTPEEKKALDDAQADARASNERIKALETEIKSEKAASAKLSDELKAASERSATLEASVIDTEIDGLVGKKITPAERDEHVALAKEIGLDRVKAIVEKRTDLKLTDPVKVDGEEVKGAQPPPPPATDGGDASADIANEANKRATA